MFTVATASPYAAAGAYLGFTLQDVRLAFHLITVPPGCSVSIEHRDDVAVHLADGTIIHEQVKSAPKSEPLRDTSPEFWKTLANWGQIVKPVNASTASRFQLYVMPPRSGHIATAVHAAKTDMDADAVIKATDGLLKVAGKTVKVQIKRFQDLPLETRRYVIRNTAILNTDEDEYSPLYKAMASGVAIRPAVVTQAIRYIVGLAQTEARELIGSGKPAILSGDKFKNELQEFVRRTNMQRLLPNAAKPNRANIEAEFVERPIFVRQLELIQATRDQQITAVADFLQASASKATWSADGLVLASNLDRWEDTLTSAHGGYQMRIAVELRDKSPEERGRVLLSYCYMHKEKLEADDVGQEFVRGSFHGLADQRRVIWHDDYTPQLVSEE